MSDLEMKGTTNQPRKYKRCPYVYPSGRRCRKNCWRGSTCNNHKEHQ